MKPIRVMIVDDSAVFRGLWGKLLEVQEDMEVTTTAANGVEAINKLQRYPCDVILLDIEMPEMDGFEALPKLLEIDPTVKVIILSSVSKSATQRTLEALNIGAKDFLQKPEANKPLLSVTSVSEELLRKIRAFYGQSKTSSLTENKNTYKTRNTSMAKLPHAIVIGSSTGGPNALAEVLENIPTELRVPIFIVQHMPTDFLGPLADRITKCSNRKCMLATDKMIVEDSVIYLAPGDFHMTLKKDKEKVILELNKESPENFCRPAVDPLFRSATEVYGPRLLGIILTGMGEDGRRGSEKVVQNGGYIVAQDESSSVVWGMPGAVAQAGLASQVLPLNQIQKFYLDIFIKKAS